MTLLENLTSLSRNELLSLVVNQQHQIVELTARIAALQAEIERLTRGAKRQAAPFSTGTRVSTPKRPGRKPGSGHFCYRAAPQSDQITGPPVEAPVMFAACSDCGGAWVVERVDLVYTTDIPPRARPQVTQYRVVVCRCLLCGKQVRGQHPDVAPD